MPARTRQCLPWLLLMVSACGPKAPEGRTPAEIQAVTEELAKAKAQLDARNAKWHATVSEAYAQRPVLGDPCPVDYDAGYPIEHFGDKAYQGVTVNAWDEKAQSAHVQNILGDIRTIEHFNGPDDDPEWSMGKVRARLTDDFWTYDLVAVEESGFIPPQGDEGKFTAGSRVVRAMLYDYEKDAVICEALYTVGNGETITLQFDHYGTAKEHADMQARLDQNKASDEVLAAAVMIDLDKKSYYGASKKLRSVVRYEPVEVAPSGAGDGDETGGETRDETSEGDGEPSP